MIYLLHDGTYADMRRESDLPLTEPRFTPWLFFYSWERRELKVYAEFNPKSDLPDEFEYVDLESVVGTTMVAHRRETKLSAPSRAQRLAKNGDIFYQTVRPYQKNNFLFELQENNYVFSTGYAQLRPHIFPKYLMTLLQTDDFVKEVLNNCTGSSYPAINSNDLSEIKVTVTTDDTEQHLIGTLFSKIDHLITLHQRKFEKQNNIDFLKNYLPTPQKSPSNTQASTLTWERRELGELSSLITKGTTPLDKSNTGKVNFVKIENIDSASGEINITQKISLKEHEGYLRRSQLKEKDILFSIAGTLGRVTSVKSDILPANTNQALAIVRLKEGNHGYIETYLKGKSVSDYIRRNPTIGAQPNLSLEQVSNLEIDLPNKEEQSQIGQFFRSLDNLITLHQRE